MKLNMAHCTFLVFLMFRFSSQYVELTVEDDDLCSSTKKRKIKLDKGSRSALVVTTTYELNTHPTDWEKNKRCKFQVSPSSSREGIIAVIQSLTFRKNATGCVDYVQFIRKDGSASQKYCGQYDGAIGMDSNQNVNGGSFFAENAFVGKGELDVVIFVAKERLKSDDDADLIIVFTAYMPCSYVFKHDTAFRPCSTDRAEFCIYSGFFKDSYYNCPQTDCVDEDGCLKSVDTVSNFYGNKVLIGAVSSIFLVFALFVFCLWACKTYRIFCWTQTFANPSSSTPESRPRESLHVIEFNEQTGSQSSASQPNNANSNQIDEDKDLPPSYDSLFPNR